MPALNIARGLVLLSFVLAFTLSYSGWFERFSSATLFGMGALVSAGGFWTLHWLSSRFRGYSRQRGLKRLTRVQTLRFFGLLALVKAQQHVLPAIFGVPTGVMDAAMAITSFYVADRLVPPSGRPPRSFFVWHILGLVSLAISVTLAILTSPTRFGLLKGGLTSQPMTWFPMSLVPTFIGPLVLICHLLALVTASATPKQDK
ncbi:MAG TPA: hypothetical protein VL285_12775 [Bryobacteraceae bacterium]|nr:hypothetical protein [Bryobacteraceae bacterium]